jgi:excisionase family DNA binding protein
LRSKVESPYLKMDSKAMESMKYPMDMLTVGEVANILYVHKNTVRRWSDRGILNAYPIGPRGDRRYRRDDLYSFLTEYRKNNGDYRKIQMAWH